nr:helix-turn-helix transcriptional regulator [Alkanindiges hydrocarboniclasticus]
MTYRSCSNFRIHLSLLYNMDRSYLGRIERGEVNPTLEKIYELADALKISPTRLLPVY